MSRVLDEVYVATCDKEIFDYVESIGGKAVMTAKTHQRASDRTAEAMLRIEKNTGSSSGIVVMIQGDEPMLHPEMIGESIVPMIKSRSIQVVNLMGYLKNRQEHNDPHEIILPCIFQGNLFPHGAKGRKMCRCSNRCA
jgi:3-deoxy-manno-octulosonate cytidylyltransferase (CMP-KDO synthetase)